MAGCKYLSSIHLCPFQQHLLGLCSFQLNAGDEQKYEQEEIWTVSNRIPLYKPRTTLFSIEICSPDSSTNLVSWNFIVILKYCSQFALSLQTRNSKSSWILSFLEASWIPEAHAKWYFVALVRQGGNFPRFALVFPTLNTYLTNTNIY